VQSLQEELQDLCREKGVADAKLLELDGLVNQLLAVNQSLVKQLSNDSGIKTIKKITTKKKIIKKPKAPKVASMDTLSSHFNKHPNNEKMLLMNHANHLKEIESLKNMHNMYSKIARNIKKSSKGDSTSVSDTAQVSSSSSSSYSAPSAKKNNTRLSRKKAQRSEQQQQHHLSSYPPSASIPTTKIKPPNVFNTSSHQYSSHSSNYNNNNSGSMDVRLPKPSVSFDSDYENSKLDMSSDRDEDYNNNNSNTSSHMNHPQYRSDNNNSMPRSILSTSKNHTRSSFAHDQAEVKEVISSLEEEFDVLNTQYRNLLSNVQAHPSTSTTGSSIVRDAPSHISPDTIQAQAEEIVNVIQKLHKKGEQIRSLKNASP